MKKLFLLILLIGTILSVKAQVAGCGTFAGERPNIISKQMQDSLNKILAVNTPYCVRLYITFFADDNGTNISANRTDILNRVQSMASQYQAHNICFMIMDIRQINNTDLNDQNPTETAELSPYIVSNCLNIFIHKTLPGLFGTAYSIPSTFLSLSSGAITANSYSVMGHEVGHCLGLYHTFEDFGGGYKENVARSGSCTNCTTKGDLICDTPADDNGGVNAACVYTGTGTDACGATFAPMTDNLMGYGNYSCNYFLTSGQGLQMRSKLISNASLTALITQDVAFFPDAPSTFYATNFGFSFRTARDELYISHYSNDSYQISGTAEHIIQSKKIYLKPGTHFFPSTGKVTIKANPFCN